MENLPKSIVEAINSLKKNPNTPESVLSGQTPAGGSFGITPSLIHTTKYPNPPELTGIQFLEKVNNRANITQKLAVSMYANGNYAHLKDAILRSSRCTGVRDVENEQTRKTFLCMKRWCANCINIQASILVKRFKPIYNSLTDLYFVTLTTKNPNAENLGNHIKKMNSIWSSIHRNIKEYQKLSFDAIKKIEYTDGNEDGRIHPHFHIIVQGKKQAEEIVKQWIERCTKELITVSPRAQHIRECDENGLFEALKYVHKSLKQETTENKEGKITKTGRYFVDGYKVNEAWKQITSFKFRLIQTYGAFYGIKVDLTEQEMKEEVKSTPLNGIANGRYIRDRGSLYHLESGEVVIKPNYKQKVFDTRLNREIHFTEAQALSQMPLECEIENQIKKEYPQLYPSAPPSDGAHSSRVMELPPPSDGAHPPE